MQPSVVIVTGVAQINRDILDETDQIKGSNYQAFYDGLKSTATIKKAFFQNINSASPNTKIYCTQIVQLLGNDTLSLISSPFYGDIYVKITSLGMNVDCSRKGEIEAYVSGFSENSKHFKFSNVLNGQLLSYNETEYYKAIYESKGMID